MYPQVEGILSPYVALANLGHKMAILATFFKI